MNRGRVTDLITRRQPVVRHRSCKAISLRGSFPHAASRPLPQPDASCSPIPMSWQAPTCSRVRKRPSIQEVTACRARQAGAVRHVQKARIGITPTLGWVRRSPRHSSAGSAVPRDGERLEPNWGSRPRPPVFRGQMWWASDRLAEGPQRSARATAAPTSPSHRTPVRAFHAPQSVTCQTVLPSCPGASPEFVGDHQSISTTSRLFSVSLRLDPLRATRGLSTVPLHAY